MISFWTLFYKEILRFWKVGFQTVFAPVLTAFLYLLIFSHVLDKTVQVYGEISYGAFLLPGLVMMSVLQNAFANASSSLIQSKVMGNIFFVLVTPISYLEFLLAYLFASVARGVLVGACVWSVGSFFVPIMPYSWLIVFAFAVLASALLGAFGVIAGIFAEKFDHLAAFQNFFIMPLTFLSGVFYSIHSLPAIWQTISRFNPFFYMIDGFRYGFFGVSDIPVEISLWVTLFSLTITLLIAIGLLRTGYRLRN